MNFPFLRGKPLFGLCVWLVLVGLGAAFFSKPLCAQVLINEVISDNGDEGPADIEVDDSDPENISCTTEGGVPDIVEIYNTTDEPVVLGNSNPALSYALSDSTSQEMIWTFPNGTTILPNSWLLVYCDNDFTAAQCELHATFQINSNGSEPITLWGPEGPGGLRPVVDRMYLPPLRRNVSFGRFPDGEGGANVAIADTLDVFNFNPPGTSTFGSCSVSGAQCLGGVCNKRTCIGAENGPGGNLEPRVNRVGFSEAPVNNRPAAGEPVTLRVRVTDDKDPIPGDIEKVDIQWWVNGLQQTAISMVYDAGLGVRDGAGFDPPEPLNRWTEWQGTIPGQAAGAVVEFIFYVEDAEGLSSTSPRTLCPEGVGPCSDIGLPGPGCERDPATGNIRFVECRTPNRYVVGYQPTGTLSQLVINEVVPSQDAVLRDVSDTCDELVNPGCKNDDYIELYNGSSETISLAGMWLSNRPFVPQGWPFPAGASIAPGEYLIVWVDGDGGLCPRPEEDIPGDGQQCPDPNDVASKCYHTDFTLDRFGDQIYLIADAEADYAVVHAVEYDTVILMNNAINLLPDGDRGGMFEMNSTPSPGARNPNGVAPTPPGGCRSAPDPEFIRGDASNDGGVDISDPIFVLNFLFGGGSAPVCRDAADANDDGGVDIADPIFELNFLFGGGPPIFDPTECGTDPTEDDLPTCEATACGS